MGNLLNELVELQDRTSEIVQLKDIQRKSIRGVLVGKLASVTETGTILVDYQGNHFGHLSAQSIVSITFEDKKKDVLLAFENNDPRLPVIIGLIQKQPVIFAKKIAIDKNENMDVVMDGERIVFNAKKEIELRCGKSSLIMKKDGKVVIRGTQLVSRASRLNKIKGAAVKIN